MGQYVHLDFEYTRPQEQDMRVLCAAVLVGDDLSMTNRFEFWLEDPEEVKRLRKFLLSMSDTSTLVAYNAIAEARCMTRLGLDPTQWQWCDLFLEHRMLTNHFRKHRYGHQWVQKGDTWEEIRGIPFEHVVEARLVNAQLRYCTTPQFRQRDPRVKDACLDLILEDREYSAEERRRIQDYCWQDVLCLPELREGMARAVLVETSGTAEDYIRARAIRGRWAADLARMEHTGISLRLPAVQSIGERHEDIAEQLRRDCNRHFPFYVWEGHNIGQLFLAELWRLHGRGEAPEDLVDATRHMQHVVYADKKWTKRQDKDLQAAFAAYLSGVRPKGKWVQKGSAMAAFVMEKGLSEDWPTTASGGWSTADDTLKAFSSIPAIRELRRTQAALHQIKWFRPQSLPEFMSKVGKDDRIRPYFNPCGTQTGRNAPPAKHFPPAMSKWLRCIVEPPAGYAIVAMDYSSQEVLIAGLESGDQNLIEAWLSRDPYLDFGKRAGAIPVDGTKSSHPKERQIFKGAALGIQYGIGELKLGLSILQSTGESGDPRTVGKTYIELHKKAYPKYWAWKAEVERLYRLGNPLQTRDGWTLGGDSQSILSALNFPIQGGGSTVLRAAVRRCHDAGLTCLFPLHDAVYCLMRDDETLDTQVEVMKEALCKGHAEVYPESPAMRVDVEIHRHGQVWIEEGAEDQFRGIAPLAGLEYEERDGHFYWK